MWVPSELNPADASSRNQVANIKSSFSTSALAQVCDFGFPKTTRSGKKERNTGQGCLKVGRKGHLSRDSFLNDTPSPFQFPDYCVETEQRWFADKRTEEQSSTVAPFLTAESVDEAEHDPLLYAPFLDENVESSMCETSSAIHDPSASNPCDPCSGSAPKYDTDRCTLRALSDLARATEAMGLDNIWPGEKPDDEDSKEDPRVSPPHTRRTLQARRARQGVRRCIDKISARLSPDHMKQHL